MGGDFSWENLKMIGNRYKLFGTDNIFEITSINGNYLVITMMSANGQEVGVLMSTGLTPQCSSHNPFLLSRRRKDLAGGEGACRPTGG